MRAVNDLQFDINCARLIASHVLHMVFVFKWLTVLHALHFMHKQRKQLAQFAVILYSTKSSLDAQSL